MPPEKPPVKWVPTGTNKWVTQSADLQCPTFPHSGNSYQFCHLLVNWATTVWLPFWAMFWFVCFVGSLPCIDPESSKEVPQEIAQRVGRVGGLFAAIICLCSSGLSEHPWDSQTTLLALFQNKGRILERYTELRGYLCGRLDGLLFLGNPGRILGEVRRDSLCVGPGQTEEALLCGVLIFQICVYQTHSVPRWSSAGPRGCRLPCVDGNPACQLMRQQRHHLSICWQKRTEIIICGS